MCFNACTMSATNKAEAKILAALPTLDPAARGKLEDMCGTIPAARLDPGDVVEFALWGWQRRNGKSVTDRQLAGLLAKVPVTHDHEGCDVLVGMIIRKPATQEVQ